MKPAKSSIARVSLAFFCLASYLASASDDTASIDHIKGTLDILNGYIQSDQMQFFQGWKAAELSALADVVPVQYQNRVVIALTGTDMDGTVQNPYHNTNAYLEALLRAFYGTVPNNNYPVSYSLSDYMSEMRYYLASMYLFQQTNRPSSSSSSSQDILAGNPWWATNSAFTMTKYRLDQVYPLDSNIRLQSFPEFMSRWSARLTRPTNGRTWTSPQAKHTWWQSFGTEYSTENYSDESPYTWFDFVADSIRSNWVAQATEQSTLDSILAASLASGSTNIVNVVVTNIVGGVTNILSADDVLAGNPWWHTNSGFRIAYHNSLTEPFPSSPDGTLSFPQFMSLLSGSHVRFQTPPVNDSREWLLDSWGFDRYNTRRGLLFTFEDWIAEMVRSNLVLTTSSSATNIEDELFAAGYDTDTSDTITNTPLPDYSLPSSESMPEAENVLQQGESTVNSFIQSLPQPGTGGDPEIVLIPEFSVGGIHVREYRASLSSPIVPTCHAVLSFLYAVGLACFVFKMAKAEYVYYASIGRQWGRYD